jgi:hypothetical protein
MQFGHRVKSVTLADFKPEELDAISEGGNQVRSSVQAPQNSTAGGDRVSYSTLAHPISPPLPLKVAAYRYLARYTPDRDVKRPTDK